MTRDVRALAERAGRAMLARIELGAGLDDWIVQLTEHPEKALDKLARHLIDVGLLGRAQWLPIDWSSPPKGDVFLYWPATQDKYGRNRLSEMTRVGYAGSTPLRKPSHYMPLPAPPPSADAEDGK